MCLSLLLLGCEKDLDLSTCEHNPHMRCEYSGFPENCQAGHEVYPWLFQQTWFTKPERNRAHFGAIFGGDTGKFWYPGVERDGSYCILDETIIFKNDVPDQPIEKIKIIHISETEMILRFADLTEVTYYNPKHNGEISPELEALLKKSNPSKN